MPRIENIDPYNNPLEPIDLNAESLLEEVPTITNLYPGKTMKNNGRPVKAVSIIIGVFVALFLLWLVIVKRSGTSILNPFSSGKNFVGSQETKVAADLTGELFSPTDAGSWINERPLAVMVNNHVDARPQSGLIYADMVYEVVAEGGITRYIAVFQSKTPEKIGPVRSTREYYLIIVKELGDAMLMHIGYSPQALLAIDTWPVRSLFRGGCESLPGCEWRSNPRNVAYEHTAFVNGVLLRQLATTLGWEGKGDITLWKFKNDTNKYSTKPSASGVTIDFWTKGDYTGIFKYNAANNAYLRFTGYDASGNPIPLMDQEQTAQQVEVKNLIVQFATESTIVEDVKGRLEYQLVGSGKAIVFLDGRAINATWSKAS